MRDHFDARIVAPLTLELVRQCQLREPCLLGGGAALAGAFLGHRRSRDIDLFCAGADGVRSLAAALPEAARAAGMTAEIVRDAGSHVRARAVGGPDVLEVDLVYEPTPELEAPPPPLEGVRLRSYADLRASKLTCILSRSEPRDLVDLMFDLMFLERAGHAPERDLPLALTKDAGIDPGVLSWLLAQFPLRPLPDMLEPLTEHDLKAFRDALGERMRRLAVPER